MIALFWGNVITVDALMLRIRGLPVIALVFPMITIVFDMDSI